MSLIHALIAKGTVVLAEHATQPGSFKPAAQLTILQRIPPNDSKLTYVHGNSLIHYVSSKGYVYLVVADDTVGRRTPFAFLGELERRFQALLPTLPSSSSSAPTLHAYNSTLEPILQDLMERFSAGGAGVGVELNSGAGQQGQGQGQVGGGNPDALKKAREDLDSVRDIMVQNIDSILARGERIELLVDKTDTMAGQAYAFRRGARGVRRQMWWKNTKIMMLSGVVCILLVYLLIAQFCGLTFGSCRS